MSLKKKKNSHNRHVSEPLTDKVIFRLALEFTIQITLAIKMLTLGKHSRKMC